MMSQLIKILVGGLVMVNGWLWNPSLELLIAIEVVGACLVAWGLYGIYRWTSRSSEEP